MRISAISAITVGAIAGASCLATAVWAAPAGGNNQCVTIHVSAPAGTHGQSGGGFSARLVDDLTVAVRFPGGVTDSHVLALDFATPKGFLYETVTVPVAAPNTAPRMRHLKGYPRPVRELVPRSVTSGGSTVHEVDVPFPVGGTMIVTDSLYGTWNVSPRLDGAEQPCAPPTSFGIVP
jgi:hypothetical protein